MRVWDSDCCIVKHDVTCSSFQVECHQKKLFGGNFECESHYFVCGLCFVTTDLEIDSVSPPPHFSQSDGDSVQVDSAAVDLLPSMAPNMEFKVERGVDTAALSELTKLIVDQQHMMQELKDVQERNFQVLQDRISEVKSSVLEEQRAGLSEIRVDQRILWLL